MLRRHLVLACVFLLIPSVSRAQSSPDRFIPAGSQVFVHWDGMNAHQDAFKATALGKTLEGDSGKFLTGLHEYVHEILVQLSAREAPAAAPFLREVPLALNDIHQNGIVFGIEVKSVQPPDVQATLVFPKAAGRDSALLPLMRHLMEIGKGVKETKVGDRTIIQPAEDMPVQIGWWAEGDDVVFSAGTHNVAEVAKNVGSMPNVTKSDLYKKLTQFKEFTTAARGYIDTKSAMKLISSIHPTAEQVIEDLGLNGLQSITFQSGFDKETQHSVTFMQTSTPRKGLLAMSSRKSVSLKDLPKLPSDVTAFAASNANAKSVYDAIQLVINTTLKALPPEQAGMARDTMKQVEGAIGVDLGELFGSFGDMTVTYSAPSEGPLGMGQIVLAKVRDEQKLRTSLEGLSKAGNNLPLVQIEFRKKAYRGVDMTDIMMSFAGQERGLFSYAITDGWFLMASYPQPIKGFILRAKGEIPSWKTDESLTKALSAFPAEFVGIGVSDPRPGVQAVISVLPFVMNLANTLSTQFLPGTKGFDVGLIPHAQEATRYLFPNVTVTTDTGETIRIETRASF